MDPVRAKRMAEELVNQNVGRWHIRRYRNAGRTAIVFEAEKDGRQCALKIFDPEFVERAGKPIQLERIKRELRLIGEHHPHLVQIVDGGECAESGYLYVVMELIEAPNLGSALTLVPREKIAFLLHQIASAARFLEEKQLAHRDIKPDNIAVFPDFSKAVLLDLGVLRAFGNPGLTDDETRIFVGTVPPSFFCAMKRTRLMGGEQSLSTNWGAFYMTSLCDDLSSRSFQNPPPCCLRPSRASSQRYARMTYLPTSFFWHRIALSKPQKPVSP
jgi:serine/threonine protein kinase